MKGRLVIVSLVLALLVAPVALAQQGLLPLVTAGGSAFLTTKAVKLAKSMKNVTVPLSSISYQGALIAVGAGLVVIDPEGSIDGETVVGPPQPAVTSVAVELLQKNANGSTSTLGRQTVKWGDIAIPGFDPEDLGLPPNLPVALAVFLVPAPPAGASHTVMMTMSGGKNVPANFAVAVGAGGIDVGSLGLDPKAAADLVNLLLVQAEQMTGAEAQIARARPADVPQR